MSTNTRARRGGGAMTPVVVVAVLVSAVSVLPLVVIAAAAMDAGPGEAIASLLRPRVGELLRNTTLLVIVTTSACIALGVGGAWLVERTDLPGARWWRIALVAPLAVPAFVNAYAWVSLRPSLTGLGGAALITTLSYTPFVFLPVAALLRGLDNAWEDTARSLGLGPWRTFARIVLPQVRPAILGGGLLVALHLLAEFGVLALIRFPTFTTAILEQYEAAFDTSAGAVLAVALMALTAIVLTGERFARGRRSHARIGAGVKRRVQPAPLRTWRVPTLLALTAYVALSLGVPGYSLVHWLGRDGAPILSTDLVTALASTLGLALAAGLLTTAAALPVAFLLHHHRTPLTETIERVTYLASSLPGVVVALALVTLAIRWIGPLYQTSLLLVIAYAILFIPRAMVSIRAALAHAPSGLMEASRSLGVGPWQTARRVLLPLILPGLLSGFALVFLATCVELTATLLLAPTGTTTLATGFWAASDSLDYAAAAPYALAMILVSAPLTWLIMTREAKDHS
jgi:iron(III) transport system permease protein